MSFLDFLNSGLVKSVSPFNPAMGQDTKEDTMHTNTETPVTVDNITSQMSEAHDTHDNLVGMDATNAPGIDEFIAKVTKAKEENTLVQTEEDVGGTPL